MMKSNHPSRRFPGLRAASFLHVALLSGALLFSSCTSTQGVSPGSLADPATVVRIGDRADCTLTDGSHVKFKVTDVAPDALIGDATRVATKDIVSLTITRFDAVKTTEVTVLVVAGLGLMAYAVSDAVHHISINLPTK